MKGVLAIQSGENPKFLREKLYTLIEEKRKTVQAAPLTASQDQQAARSRAA